jgi:hypothetical protein
VLEVLCGKAQDEISGLFTRGFLMEGDPGIERYLSVSTMMVYRRLDTVGPGFKNPPPRACPGVCLSSHTWHTSESYLTWYALKVPALLPLKYKPPAPEAIQPQILYPTWLQIKTDKTLTLKVVH